MNSSMYKLSVIFFVFSAYFVSYSMDLWQVLDEPAVVRSVMGAMEPVYAGSGGAAPFTIGFKLRYETLENGSRKPCEVGYLKRLRRGDINSEYLLLEHQEKLEGLFSEHVIERGLEYKECELEKHVLKNDDKNRFLIRQYADKDLELFDMLDPKKLGSMHCNGTMYNMMLVPKLPLLITAEQGKRWNILKVWHLPTQTVLQTFNFELPIKEIACKKLLPEIYVFLGDGSTAQLKSIDFLNLDLLNELRVANNKLKKLYYFAVVHRSVEEVKEEISNYEKLLEECPPNMKLKIEEALNDSADENIPEEPYVQSSFWQRHKRKIICGVGIAAGASVLYGLYSWYSSQ